MILSGLMQGLLLNILTYLLLRDEVNILTTSLLIIVGMICSILIITLLIKYLKKIGIMIIVALIMIYVISIYLSSNGTIFNVFYYNLLAHIFNQGIINNNYFYYLSSVIGLASLSIISYLLLRKKVI
jgi:hypothetical protein